MKAYIIVQTTSNEVEFWYTTVGYFSNKDVADYVCAELDKNDKDFYTCDFSVREVEIRENLFDMSEDLGKIYQEIKKNL